MDKFTIRANDQTYEVMVTVSSKHEMIYIVTIDDAQLAFKANEYGELEAIETDRIYDRTLLEDVARQIESHCL